MEIGSGISSEWLSIHCFQVEMEFRNVDDWDKADEWDIPSGNALASIQGVHSSLNTGSYTGCLWWYS